MRILFVADVSIQDVIGGAERVLYEQSTGLARRGHTVHILTRRLPYHSESSDTIQGVAEWRYDWNQKSPILFFRNACKKCQRRFEALQRTYPYDCINFHQPFAALGVNRSRFGQNIPKIYTCHSLSFEEFFSRKAKANGLLHQILNFVQIQGRKAVEKRVVCQSDKIITLSQFVKDKLCDVYGIPAEKIQVIPGGVDLIKFHPAGNKPEMRKQLNIPQDKLVLLTVRNLVPRMGLENLIIALNELRQRSPEIYLVIGGKGPLEDGLIALMRSFNLEEHVHFAGFISEKQLPSYYQMADLFILPTKELEGFGLVSLEAMASGLPVLGTPVGGTKEILGKLKRPFLFAGTDPVSIASLILDHCRIIKQNPQKWEKISKEVRRFVQTHYSWAQNLNSLEDLFLEYAVA